ncbi:MAG: hypothetical protein PSV35_06525, partial [bacterium]|nr:hypothetical protein [bacterium]
TTVTFSATAGIGLRLNNLLGETPGECGYRFFYLGQGYFGRATTQTITSLHTGTAYANALVCSISI